MSWAFREWHGSGSPVLFLHGFLGRASDWEPVVTHLSPNGLAFDLPGHGNTPLGPKPSLDHWAVELARTLKDRHSDPLLVVGYSLGGRLALRLLEHAPSLVRGLVLVSASPGLDDGAERAQRAALDDQRAEEILSDFGRFLDGWYSAPLFSLEPPALAIAKERRAEVDPTSAATVIAAMSPGRAPSSWTTLAQSKVPLLYVAGALDTKYVELGAECFARREGPTDVAILSDVGHSAHVDAPAKLANALSPWIRRIRE